MTHAASKSALKLAGTPAEFRHRLERWGPTFIKIGQYLALRPDLIHDEYADELIRLFDQAEPFSWTEAERTLTDDLGPRWADGIVAIDPVPFAAASFAEVHHARLVDGTIVAVKIRRPGIEERIARDLRRGYLLALLLEWSGVALIASPREVLDELAEWLRAELDFKREEANIERMRYLAGDRRTERVPRPYPEFSSSRVLTTEYLAGEPVSKILENLRTSPYVEDERLVEIGIDRQLVAERLLDTTLRQIFDYRFFHADPHPGNLLVMEDNEIGYVDFGLCDTLDETIAANQMRYFAALYRHDTQELLRAVEDIVVPGEATDIAAFRRDFLDETDRWTKATADANAGITATSSRSPVASYMVRVMHTLRRHRMHVPARALSMYRALLTAEAVAGRLAPGANLAAAGRAFFAARERRELFRALDPERLQESVPELVNLLRNGPARVNQVLGDLANGQLALNVQVSDDPFTRRARTRYIRLIVTVLLSISVALLLTRPLPMVFGVPLSEPLLVALVLLYVSILVQWRRLPW